MLGVEKVLKLLEKNVIEIAPLAYMRGRTLNDAYVILDEAQNTTIEQMKMFLTRLGFGSTAVVTGDLTQIDLPKHVKSGLRDAVEVLRDVDGISFTFFEARDVVRHPLVARIVSAYDAATRGYGPDGVTRDGTPQVFDAASTSKRGGVRSTRCDGSLRRAARTRLRSIDRRVRVAPSAAMTNQQAAAPRPRRMPTRMTKVPSASMSPSATPCPARACRRR